MDNERLMQAILQSFLDADFRDASRAVHVEILPRSVDKPSTANTGTGPSRHLYDTATQAADGRHIYKRPSPELVRNRINMGGAPAREHVDRTAQAVDGRYASVYKVNHCKVTPTSPPLMTTEFPPQRPDVSYGGDNFQVGGMGSGETGSVPIKSSCYRGGGLNWPNRDAVYAPRASRASDSFASSLRKYPTVSPERSSEVFERLVNYSMPRTCRSPRCSPQRSPQRETISYRNPKAYEESYAASVRPRAPEDSPTRDKRDDFRKQLHTKQGDIRLIREVSRKLRKTLKSISSYSSTQNLSSAVDRNQEWCETPIPETSETDHEDPQETSHPTLRDHPVNTTVQAVASTASQGVETRLLMSRTIAVPISPSPSSRLSHRTYNPRVPVTRSVQTEMPRRSVETITSTTELKTRSHFKIVVKKSKSLSDFRLNRDLKGEILAWLDDINDPKIREIQDTVLRNLRYRLKGESVTGVEKIKVKLGNCLRRKLHTKHSSSCEFHKKHGFNSNTESQDNFFTEDTKNETDQSVFEDIIKDWLSDIAIKKRDIFLRPVKKDQIYNTFVNRLKHLLFEKSKQGREELLREEISEILDEVPIEVNNCDKSVYLTRITDNLVYRLGNIIQNKTKTKQLKSNMSDKLNMYLGRSRLMRAEKETKDFVIKAMAEVMKKQNTVNPNTVKPAIVDLVDTLMNSINTDIELEDIANVLHNAMKTDMIENCKDFNNKYAKLARSQPLAVFMVQRLSRNYIAKTSGTNMSRHNIGSIMNRDIEDNLNQYKTKLAGQINRWLSNLAAFRGNDTDFRQAAVLDLAGDIIDRQKYLEFNKDRGTDVEELEHLKYQIFKWMKRYVGEGNLEALEHAAELMEMIRNIPVPIINISQYNLNKSNSGICCRGRFEPCTSTDVTNNVYGSKSDSGICNRESRSGLASTHFPVDNVDNKKDDLLKKTRQHDPKSSIFNRRNVVINLSNTRIHDNSDISKLSNNLKNSRATSINIDSVENTNGEDIHSTQDQKNQSTCANRDTHISQDIPIRSRDNLYKYQSGVSYRDDNFEAALINNSNNELKSKSNTNYNKKETQNDAIVTNYMVHKVSNDKASDLRKQKHQSPSPSRRKIINTNIDSDSTKRSSINKKNSPEKHNRSRGSNNALRKSFASIADDNQVPGPSELRTPMPGPSELRAPVPGPSELISPVPTHSGKQSTASSAAARLMAEWRPPPVFTPPPSGQPLISQVHEDFQEYLKNWCQQIPISENTPEEIKIAEKARLGILNGIWKIITKLKTQSYALHNKFYYEDMLGKEIDGLLDCLPETEELQDKRYALKAQLLDKYSEMNDMIEELEVPANYKEVVAEKVKQREDEQLRIICRTQQDDPSKLYEELFTIAIIDDFLKESNYIETDKVLTKAYKYKLQRTLREFIDGIKKKYGKEFDQVADNIKVRDVIDLLFTVPLPTDDSIKENADAILIELEIDEWMKHLPIVKNDNETELRTRRRLRDALTKKIHELQKRGNVIDCCGDTQVKHEISVFLDKLPLERDQDLKINEMVEELTNRLKRQAAGCRRKSVAFQEGNFNNSANRSNRLLNRSQLANSNIAPDLRYSTGNEWALQNNEDIDYKDFQNPVLCSSRIEQPGDEWAIEEDEDAQYRALFKNIPANSSMIEPQAGYGEVNAPIPPDFHHSYAEAPYFEFNPGQFHESVRGGAFCLPQTPPQHIANKFQYPNLVASHRGSAQSRFYESAADLIPNASISDGQYHSLNPTSPPNVVWQVPNETPGFISMQDDLYGQPDPQMQMSGQQPNMSQRLAASLHASRRSEPPFVEPAPFIPDTSRLTRQSNASRSNRTGIDPIMIQEPLEPSFHESQRSRAASRAAMSHLQEPVILQPNAASELMSIASHQRPADPIMIQEPLEPSFHESQRSRAASRAEMSYRQDPVASIASHQPPGEMPAPACLPSCMNLETSARHHTTPAPLEMSRSHAASVIHESQRSRAASRAAMSHLQDPVVLQPNEASGFTLIPSHPQPGEMPPAPLETSRNQHVQQANEPSIRIQPAHPEFRRSTDREGIQEIINQNRSARSADGTPEQHIQGPVRGTHQVLIHEPPRDRIAEAAAAPSSPRRPDPRQIASNAPSSEISNQPAFYSTPDQRTNLAPPNIRERRQLEKERARRVNMDAEDNEGEERCHCRERFKRWHMPGPNCTTCDDCAHGGMEMAWPPMPYPYPPYPYPYMPYGRPSPTYPPYCRR